jgi:hypothetical protein
MVFAFGAVLAFYELARRAPDPAPTPEPAPRDEAPAAADRALLAPPSIADADDDRTGHTLAQVLGTLSDGARNSIFSVSIRDAGYPCVDLLSAHEAAQGAWRVGCRDARAYLVTVDTLGRLVVEPLSFSEGPAPITPNREFPIPIPLDPTQRP